MRRNVVHLKLKRGEKGNFKKHKLVKFIHVTHHCRKKDGIFKKLMNEKRQKNLEKSKIFVHN